VSSRPDAHLSTVPYVRTTCSSRPDARQTSIIHPDDICLSWSGRTHSRYGNCVLKNCRPDVHPPWSGRSKPYMEITCNGRATVQTSVSHCPDAGLKQERFSAKFLENPVAQLSVRTAFIHITAVTHSAPQPINRGPWALRTARIQY
jgi:hypothetical protein